MVRTLLSLMTGPNVDGGDVDGDGGEEESHAIVLPHKLLNQRDEMGFTPLWLAARTGNVKMAQILV